MQKSVSVKFISNCFDNLAMIHISYNTPTDTDINNVH